MRHRSGFGQERSTTKAALQNALNSAAEAGRTLFLEPGTYYLSNILLPPRTRLTGISGETRLVYSGAGHLLVADRADLVQLTDLVFDGANRPLGDYAPGIVHLIDVLDIHISGCRFMGSDGSAVVADRCGGRITGNEISGSADAGISATESSGLAITDNNVSSCANNGILVTRWTPGYDGTLVAGNRIDQIRADRGDTGPNGNAIKVFQAHGVSVAQNRIADCAFTAVRAIGADNVQVIDNNCAGLGETAIHCAMGSEGAVIADNIIEHAANGISVSGSGDGGSIATVTGNVIRETNRSGPYDDAGLASASAFESTPTWRRRAMSSQALCELAFGQAGGRHCDRSLLPATSSEAPRLASPSA